VLGPWNTLVFGVLLGFFLPYVLVDVHIYNGFRINGPVLCLHPLFTALSGLLCLGPFTYGLVGDGRVGVVAAWYAVGFLPSAYLLVHIFHPQRILVPVSETAKSLWHTPHAWVAVVWAPCALWAVLHTDWFPRYGFQTFLVALLGLFILLSWPGLLGLHRAQRAAGPSAR
jgi:hypothetical protein